MLFKLPIILSGNFLKNLPIIPKIIPGICVITSILVSVLLK